MMGGAYCFDVPASLYNTLRSHFSDTIDDDLFPIYFSGLYTFYSIANTFLPFITGCILNIILKKKCLINLVVPLYYVQDVF